MPEPKLKGKAKERVLSPQEAYRIPKKEKTPAQLMAEAEALLSVGANRPSAPVSPDPSASSESKASRLKRRAENNRRAEEARRLREGR